MNQQFKIVYFTEDHQLQTLCTQGWHWWPQCTWYHQERDQFVTLLTQDADSQDQLYKPALHTAVNTLQTIAKLDERWREGPEDNLQHIKNMAQNTLDDIDHLYRLGIS